MKKKSVLLNKFAIYARFSDKETGSFASTDAQIEVCKEYIANQGGELIDIYREDDRTGTSLNRKEYKRLLSDAHLRRFDAVVITYMSRLGRGDQYTLAKEALRLAGNIEVITVKEDFGDGPGGYVQEQAIKLIDGMYPVMVRQWTRTKMEQMLYQGLYTGGTIPLGYMAVDAMDMAEPGKRQPKRIVPNLETIDLVVEAFNLYLSSKSIAGVREFLAECTGRTWRYEATKDLLQNRCYLGEWTWGELKNTEHHVAIITEEVFANVGQLLANKPRKSHNPNLAVRRTEDGIDDNLLVGRVGCGCGGNMTPAASVGRGGKRYPTYECYRTRLGVCKGRINAQKLHALILREIGLLAKSPWRIRQTLEAEAQRRGDPKSLDKEILAAKRVALAENAKLQRLVQAVGESRNEAGRRALLSEMDRAAEAAEAANRRVEGLEVEQGKMAQSQPSVASLEALLGRFDELWAAATPEERRLIFRGFVQKVKVIQTRPTIELELALLSDFGASRKGAFEEVPSTGFANSAFKGG